MVHDYAEDLLQAVDTIVSYKLRDQKFDETIICTIVNNSDAKNGHYIVTDGTIKFDAYSDLMDYKLDESVRVSIAKGDYSQKKYIIGRCVSEKNGNQPLTYVSPSASILDVTGNIYTGNNYWSTVANGGNSYALQCLWSTNLDQDAFKDIQQNSIYDAILLKADFKTLLNNYDIVAGNFGLRLDIYTITKNSLGNDVYIRKECELDSADMFGDPYNFLIYSSQEAKFNISSDETIHTISLYLYENENFCYRNDRGENLPLISSIDKSPDIFVSNIHIGFGTDLINVEDNKVVIYTDDDLNYNLDGVIGSNDKTISLLWYNKDENNKYIGFSDGLVSYNKGKTAVRQYDEKTEYIKELEKYQRYSSQLSKTDVPNDEAGLWLSADLTELQSLFNQIHTTVNVTLFNLMRDFKAELLNLESTLSPDLETIFNQWIGTSSVDGKLKSYSLKLGNCKNITRKSEVSNDSDKDILAKILRYYMQGLVCAAAVERNNGSWDDSDKMSYTEILEDESTETYIRPKDNLRTYEKQLANPLTKNFENNGIIYTLIKNIREDFLAAAKPLIISSNINNASTYDYYEYYIDKELQKLDKYRQQFINLSIEHSKIADGEKIIEEHSSYYLFADTAQGLLNRIALDSPIFNIYDAAAAEKELAQYANKYSIYWYYYDKGYSNPEDPFGMVDWHLLEKNDQHIQVNNEIAEGEQLINIGLPDIEETDKPEYYPARALSNDSQAILSITLPKDKVEEKFKAVLIYNHESFTSNEIVFTNVNSALEAQLTDRIVIEHGLDSFDSYPKYGINNELVDLSEQNKARTLTVNYVTKNDNIDNEVLEGASVYWFIPKYSSMLCAAPGDANNKYTISEESEPEFYSEETSIAYNVIYNVKKIEGIKIVDNNTFTYENIQYVINDSATQITGSNDSNISILNDGFKIGAQQFKIIEKIPVEIRRIETRDIVRNDEDKLIFTYYGIDYFVNNNKVVDENNNILKNLNGREYEINNDKTVISIMEVYVIQATKYSYSKTDARSLDENNKFVYGSDSYINDEEGLNKFKQDHSSKSISIENKSVKIVESIDEIRNYFIINGNYYLIEGSKIKLLNIDNKDTLATEPYLSAHEIYKINKGIVTLKITQPTEESKDGYVCYYTKIKKGSNNEILNNHFIYYIKSHYSSTYTKNTIKCTVVKNQLKLTTFINFNFSSFGSNGTNYTLNINPQSNIALTPIVKTYNEQRYITHTYDFDIALYNYGDQQISFTDNVDIKIIAPAVEKAKLSNYQNGRLIDSDKTYSGTLNIADAASCPYRVMVATTKVPWLDNTITIGRYKVIPYAANPSYYIEGASEIVYDSSGGNPKYNKDAFKLFFTDENGEEHSYDNEVWSMVYYDNDGKSVIDLTDNKWGILKSYMPLLTKDNKLVPSTMFIQTKNSGQDGIEEYDLYPVVTAHDKDTKKLLWAQPIYLTQNRYASPLLNNWDGSLQIDEENGTILSSFVGAGKKNNDNSFSGVLMGEVELKAQITDLYKDPLVYNHEGIGLYGFNKGAQSFGFNVDGTAFIGRSGGGRIAFDGSHGFIYSQSWLNSFFNKDTGRYDNPFYTDEKTGDVSLNNGTQGMAIDLQNGHIDAFDFRLTSNNIYLNSSPNSKDYESSPEDQYYFRIGKLNGEDAKGYFSMDKNGNVILKVNSLYITGQSSNINLLKCTAPWKKALIKEEAAEGNIYQYDADGNIIYDWDMIPPWKSDENTVVTGAYKNSTYKTNSYVWAVQKDEAHAGHNKIISQLVNNLEEDTEYTLSGYVTRTTTTGTSQLALTVSNSADSIVNVNKTINYSYGNWTYFIYTFKTTSDNVEIQFNGPAAYGLWHLKLEEGNIATEWNAADGEADLIQALNIENYDLQLAQDAIFDKLTIDPITGKRMVGIWMESPEKSASGRKELYISATYISTGILRSNNWVGKLIYEGKEISDKKYGELSAQQKLNVNIEAEEGMYINLDQGKIWSKNFELHAGSQNSTNYIGLFSDDNSSPTLSISGSESLSSWRIIAGNQFGVTKDGKIYASAGKIAGWTISDTSLIKGTPGSNDSICLYSRHPDSGVYWRLLIGSNFKVDKWGNLKASNATLKGNIEANDGSIGGWIINKTGLMGKKSALLSTDNYNYPSLVSTYDEPIRLYVGGANAATGETILISESGKLVGNNYVYNHTKTTTNAIDEIKSKTCTLQNYYDITFQIKNEDWKIYIPKPHSNIVINSAVATQTNIGYPCDIEEDNDYFIISNSKMVLGTAVTVTINTQQTLSTSDYSYSINNNNTDIVFQCELLKTSESYFIDYCWNEIKWSNIHWGAPLQPPIKKLSTTIILFSLDVKYAVNEASDPTKAQFKVLDDGSLYAPAVASPTYYISDKNIGIQFKDNKGTFIGDWDWSVIPTSFTSLNISTLSFTTMQAKNDSSTYIKCNQINWDSTTHSAIYRTDLVGNWRLPAYSKLYIGGNTNNYLGQSSTNTDVVAMHGEWQVEGNWRLPAYSKLYIGGNTNNYLEQSSTNTDVVAMRGEWQADTLRIDDGLKLYNGSTYLEGASGECIVGGSTIYMRHGVIYDIKNSAGNSIITT